MLINPYLYKDPEDTKKISPESVKKAGIVYRKRKIYILKKYAQQCFDAESIFSSYVMNTVIIVNVSKSKCEDGTYKCIKSTYSFTYTGTNGDIISEFKNSRLMLRYCTTSGYECDETYREGKFEDSNYYNDLGIVFGYDENDDPIEINLDDMCAYGDDIDEQYFNEKLYVPDPRYYTTKQYEVDTGISGEEFILRKNRYYDAIDLIDDVSDVFVVEENELEKLNNTECKDINGDIVKVDSSSFYELAEIIRDAQLIPFDMMLLNTRSCFNSYKFIYDSKTGFNIKDVNNDKIIIKSRNSDYLKMIANRMNQFCNKLKNIYGDLRVYYYSSDISEHIEIVLDKDKLHKISCTFDRNSMFERLMVYVTDKYHEYVSRPILNIDDYFYTA